LREGRRRSPRAACDLFFPNNAGRVLTLPNLRDRVLGPLQAAAGISPAFKPKYGWHSLRHAAASLFIEQLGWSPKRLQAVKGHASIQNKVDRHRPPFGQGSSTDPDPIAENRGRVAGRVRRTKRHSHVASMSHIENRSARKSLKSLGRG